MDIQLLNKVINELKTEITGGIISNVHQIDERHIILRIFLRGKEKKLLISIHPRFFRIHLTERKYQNPPALLRFCAYLRSHIIGKRIEDISADSKDRNVRISFKDFLLIAELTGRDSNVILTSQDGIIFDAMRYFPDEKKYPRPVVPGLPYIPLPVPEKPVKGIDIPIGEFSSYNASIDAYYAVLTEAESFARERTNLAGIVSNTKKKAEKKLNNLFADRQKAEENLKLQKHGELLLANFNKIKKGMKEVCALDYYNSPPQEVLIPIDPALSPQGNIDKIFKRVKKAKTAVKLLGERIPSVEDEIKYLEDVLFQIDSAENKDDISAIKDELKSYGYLKAVTERNKRIEGRTEPIRRFKSTDNCSVLCGKTSTGNDLLLKKYARDYDLWFHVHGTSGSHVLLMLKERNKEASGDSILEAGTIAAFFSKARNSAKAEVAYTAVKNIKKPKGAKSGLVTITNYRTIIVKPDEEIVKRLSVYEKAV